MTAKKRNTTPDWNDPDDAPEWDADAFARAEIAVGGKVVRRASGTLTKRGRPPVGDAPKKQVTMRFAPDLIAKMRATGPGWQTRAEQVLRNEFVSSTSMYELMSRGATTVVREARAGKLNIKTARPRGEGKKRA